MPVLDCVCVLGGASHRVHVRARARLSSPVWRRAVPRSFLLHAVSLVFSPPAARLREHTPVTATDQVQQEDRLDEWIYLFGLWDAVMQREVTLRVCRDERSGGDKATSALIMFTVIAPKP